MSKSKKKGRAEIPEQTGVRWHEDDRAILMQLYRYHRRTTTKAISLIAVLRDAIRVAAARYGVLPKRFQPKGMK